MYDYGDRQERVDFLLSMLRAEDPAKVVRKSPVAGGVDKDWTAPMLIAEIEQGTDEGRAMVAVAGFVFHAMKGEEFHTGHPRPEDLKLPKDKPSV